MTLPEGPELALTTRFLLKTGRRNHLAPTRAERPTLWPWCSAECAPAGPRHYHPLRKESGQDCLTNCNVILNAGTANLASLVAVRARRRHRRRQRRNSGVRKNAK